jgi:hypothetical protein
MVEGVAGLEARKAGYDAIWAVDPTMPELDEFVGLTDNALSKVDSVPSPAKVAQEGAQGVEVVKTEPIPESVIAKAFESDSIKAEGEKNVSREGRETPGRDRSEKRTSDKAVALSKAVQYLEGNGVQRINAEIADGNTLEQRQIERILEELGVRVVYYKSDTTLPISGIFDPSLKDTVFIRESDTRNMAWAAGHEFFHTLKVNHPDLYGTVIEIYKGMITTEQKTKFLKTFDKTPAYQERLLNNEDDLIGEMLSDEAGNVFTNKTFWENLYDKSKDLFDKIVTIARDLFSKIKGLEYINYLDREQAEQFERAFETIVTAVKARVAEGGTEAKKAGEAEYEGAFDFSAREKEERSLSKETVPQYDERISTESPEDIRKKYRGEFHTVSKEQDNKFDIGEFIKKAYDKAFNTLEELNRFGKAYGQKPNEGLYAKAMAAKMSDKQARIILTQRMIDAEGITTGKSLKEILAPLSKDKKLMSILDDYLVYKHAPSWIAKGRTVFAKDLNIDIDEVNKRAAEIELAFPELVQIQKEIVKFQQQLAEEWLVKTGILDKKTWRQFQKDYPDYVPLMRSFASIEKKGGYRPKSGYVNQSSPIKRGKGSERDIINPIESIIEHVGQYTKIAKRNEAGQAFLDIVRANREDLDGIAKELWPDIVMLGGPGKTVAAQVLDSKGNVIENMYFQKTLEEDGIEGVVETLNRLYQFQDTGTGTVLGGRTGKGQVVTVLVNGRPVHIEVFDEDLLNSLLSLTPRQQQSLAKAVGSVTKAMKTLTTGLNLSFGIARNVWNDLVTGYVSSKTINANPLLYFKYIADLTAAIGDMLATPLDGKLKGGLGDFINRAAEKYKLYENMGGGAFASSISSDVKHLMRAKKDVLGKRHIGNYIMGTLETINNTLETAPRLAEFKRMVEQEGNTYKGRVKAMYEANDLTVNFSRFGDDVKALDNITPFLNAAMQGIDKTVRIYKDNPVRAILKSIYAVTIPSIILFMLNHRDDEHEEAYNMLSNYIKDNNFCIPYRDSEGVKFIKIPKGREIGIIWGALTERVLRMYAENEPEAFRDYAANVWNNWSPPNPVTDNIAFPAFRSLVLGKNWRFTDLETYAERQSSPEYRYNESTSGVSKAIGKTVGISPKRLDDFFKSYFGGIAQYGIPLTSEKSGDIGKTFIQQVTADPVYSTDALNNFYRLRTKLTAKYSDHKSGNYKITATEYDLYKYFNKASDILSDYRKSINAADTTAKKREFRKAMNKYAAEVYEQGRILLEKDKD